MNFYNMKKILFGLMALGVSGLAMAEGYQVNTLSAKQGGMGHTGVAQKLGAESMFFNPAGMAFMNKTLDISGSVNGVMATAKAKIDGSWYETDNDVSTPMMLGAAFSIYDNLKAGINLYTPYGSNINWTNSWPGAILNQSVKLSTFTIQPSIAWRITPKLSVGAGLMISWGSVDLNKGLVNPASMDNLIGILSLLGQIPAGASKFGNTMPASVNLTGTANVACGINIGAMYDINDQWTVGADFRSKMTMKVKAGDAKVSYANDLAAGILESEIGIINSSDFTAEMPMPAVVTFGVSYKPLNNLLIAFDAQFTGWKTYKDLDIEFLDENAAKFNQHLVKDYKDAWAFRLGAQYGLTDRFDIRAGFIVDLSPVNDNYYNPETPGMTKLEPSVGFSFRPIPNLSIDLSALYVAGLGVNDVNCGYVDFLAAKLGASMEKSITADYKVHAFVPSIGVSFSF